MDFKKLFLSSVVIFLPICIVSVMISFLYRLWIYEQAVVDWPIAVLLAIGLTVLVTWLQNRGRKQQQE